MQTIIIIIYFMNTLKHAGLKTTHPRKVVLNLLISSEQQYFSTNAVYDALVAKGEHLSMGTIYRILSQFEQAKLVIAHRFIADAVVYELYNEEHHDHLIDISTGKVIEFYDETIEQRQQAIADEYGFKLLDHRLVMYGVFENEP